MKKICIALDYSPISQKLSETGYALAETLDAEVALIHVLDDKVFYGIDEETVMGYDVTTYNEPEVFAARITTDMQRYLDSVARHLGKRVVLKKLTVGSKEKAILKFAESWKADIIVIGSHGHSDFHNLVLGNTALKIVKHSKIPLLIVPAKK